MNGTKVIRLMVHVWLISMAAMATLERTAGAENRCDFCHGTTSDNRPQDSSFRDPETGGFQGNHRTHMGAGATAFTCSVCHPGSAGYVSGHRDGRIKLSSNINASPAGAVYHNRTSSFPQTATPSLGSCTNVNCHFERETPVWGISQLEAPAGCSTCHGAPPSDGSHPALAGSGKKHGEYYGSTGSCSRCHPNHAGEGAPFQHATSAGKRGLTVVFGVAPNSGGSYSGDLTYPGYLPSQHPSRSGSCTTLYCHSNGTGGSANVPPVWGGSLPVDCTGCHGGNVQSAVPMSTGSHSRHVSAGNTCSRCHSATAGEGDDRSIGTSANHVDGAKTVAFSAGGSYTRENGSCSATYCHGTGTPVWGGSLPADCTGCHGGDSAAIVLIATGKHRAHLENYSTLGQGNSIGCVTCHAATVDDNRHVVSSGRHADGYKDYSGARAGVVVPKGSGQCSGNYCHSSGSRENLFWNMTAATWYSARALGCRGCHGTATLPDGTVASFASVAGEPAYSNGGPLSGRANSHERHVGGAGVTDTSGCAACHNATVDAGAAEKLRNYSTLHLNGQRDVNFSVTASLTGVQGRYSSTTQQCINTACHGAAASVHWGSTALACTSCHSAEATGFSASGAGAHSLHYETATAPAAGTYGTMAPDNAGTASTYQFGCTACHGAPATHASGPADSASGASAQVFFGYTSPGLAGNYRYGTGLEAQRDKGFGWSAGTCRNIYCHSNGNGGFGNMTAFSWNSTAGALGDQCRGCHGGNRQSEAPIATNAHPAHMNNDAILGTSFDCVACHAPTVSADRTLVDKRRHVNKFKDYSGARAGGSTNYDRAAGQCSNLYCHSNGKAGTGVAAYVNPPAWRGGASLGCNGCHGTGNAAGAPDYVSDGVGGVAANSHERHAVASSVTAAISCYVCHYETAATGTTLRGGVQPSRHINGKTDEVFFNLSSAPYSAGTKSCNGVYCHSNGLPFDREAAYKSVTWGGAAQGCTSCHDSGGDATGLSGRHAKHTGGSYTFSCERCHRATATGNSTINDKSIHVNRAKDVTFREGGSYESSGKGCSSSYCHSDARGGTGRVAVKWSDTSVTMTCTSCHRGTQEDSTPENCAAIQGVWSTARVPGDNGYCTPSLTMASNGHERLVGLRWIRKYPCTYCHNATVGSGTSISDYTRHVNGTKDVAMSPQWAIVGRDAPSYNAEKKECNNVYCHSDGTTNPEKVRGFGWTQGRTECNTCHGHPRGSCSTSDPLTNTYCHDGRVDSTGKVWVLPAIYGNNTSYSWPVGQEWKAAIPMFRNEGPGTARANSHPRHTQTDFTCDQCHAATIKNGICTECHSANPSGAMSEVAHLDGSYHVNKTRDVVFKQGGSYSAITKSCSNTACHSGGTDPVWGGSVSSAVICLSCHGTAGADADSFVKFNGTQAKINLTEWVSNGHGRPTSSGPYPASGNPAANFPGNPCWYCHDNSVLHNDAGNPFRLRLHAQFTQRFEKECVYCHMERVDAECVGCHVGQNESLAPQATDHGVVFTLAGGAKETRYAGHTQIDGCTATAECHDTDSGTFATGAHKGHNSEAGVWSADQKADIKNQYMMMGVCLQCHDDDSGGKCTSCHVAPADNPLKYTLGFDPGTGRIKPQKARASSVHFGYKHYKAYKDNNVWKGGKFCWDCHDPHGDSNIYMVQSKVATATDGVFGIPQTRADVVFTRKQSGIDYARTAAPYNGICNVCHAAGSQHYRSDGGDGHNASRVCTVCHEHRFSDSHADKLSCATCHNNKPVPRHSAFGLPRDCTKCHAGTVGKRMDIMGQMRGTSHHVQGVEITNKHCYACHWESTPEGLIDIRYHQGYNYKNYSTAKNAVVDLVVWGPQTRPVAYKLYSTAVQFLAANIGTVNERSESAKLTGVCISCHSDQNNDIKPFGDCKTPRQYAWDRQSVAARYSQTGTTSWGKYNSTTYPNAAKKDTVVKAFSAHGNAVANQGGWSATTGVDEAITNSRAGNQGVQCFDCHSSHGSKLVGVTSSYVTFNGTKNGGNLKETQAGKGGYTMTYKASANTAQGAINPYSAGAGQCFDCHLTATSGTTPWGYSTTFGASAPIKGYMDSDRFGDGSNGYSERTPFKAKSIKGGHFKASAFLNRTTAAQNKINGLCTPCHDPHGVSPSLGSDQAYAVPMLKGTWMTSPYKEDTAVVDTANPPNGQQSFNAEANVNTDKKTFGGSTIIAEDEGKFAGLCTKCHAKSYLTNGTDHTWKGKDRVHESVKGWKTANTTIQHNFTCSKCHTPHTSGLPRLMQTNCLDVKHRGKVASGGQAGSNSGVFSYSDGSGSGSFPKGMGASGVNCHPTGTWPDNSWNRVTPW